MGVRPATQIVRDWIMDSRHWQRFNPRDGDIVIATAPKCGTTWTQRIVSLLVFQTPEPMPLDVSPWLDCRFMMPLEAMLPMLEGQRHRRFIKSHLPLTALPLYDTVRYIHTAREGKDSCMSFFNHHREFKPEALARFDEIGAADETIAGTFPRMPDDEREFFHAWLAANTQAPDTGYFALERSYWRERARENLLLVHYNDLKADLDGEMRRISAFLDIPVDEAIWRSLVDAARFETMKAQGAQLMPGIENAFRAGHESFLYRGSNERWREVLTDEDLAAYERAAREHLPPGLYAWLQSGRRKAVDPKASAD